MILWGVHTPPRWIHPRITNFAVLCSSFASASFWGSTDRIVRSLKHWCYCTDGQGWCARRHLSYSLRHMWTLLCPIYGSECLCPTSPASCGPPVILTSLRLQFTRIFAVPCYCSIISLHFSHPSCFHGWSYSSSSHLSIVSSSYLKPLPLNPSPPAKWPQRVCIFLFCPKYFPIFFHPLALEYE